MSAARETILLNVRAALAGAARPGPASREYRRADTRSQAELVRLFHDRVADYRAEVVTVSPGGLADAIAAAAVRHGAERLAIPREGLPQAWLERVGAEQDEAEHAGAELVRDDALSARQLDELDGVITGCTVAVAETGTIALSGAPQEGRRLLSLVPDLHICVVHGEQIVALLPEALTRLHAAVAEDRRPVTFISGPSATSDIELERVEGVHGPRQLVVVIVQESDVND
ncbi:MAG: lactate utilization protein C [Conexibacteraceae bacterium]|nr:lactate utilization protein C [Conexibacteraceae bacterium]